MLEKADQKIPQALFTKGLYKFVSLSGIDSIGRKKQMTKNDG